MCICGGFLTPQIARIHLYFFGYNRDLSGQGLLVATVGALSPYVGCACLGVLGFVAVLICMFSLLLDVLLATVQIL
jgi:hypothetical protein